MFQGIFNCICYLPFLKMICWCKFAIIVQKAVGSKQLKLYGEKSGDFFVVLSIGVYIYGIRVRADGFQAMAYKLQYKSATSNNNLSNSIGLRFSAPNSFIVFFFLVSLFLWWSTFHNNNTEIFLCFTLFSFHLHANQIHCFQSKTKNFIRFSFCGYFFTLLLLINVFFFLHGTSFFTFQCRDLLRLRHSHFAGMMLKGFDCIISQIGKVVK